MTESELLTKMELMAQFGQRVRSLKAELDDTLIGLRAHEHELAKRVIDPNVFATMDHRQTYLVGRQIYKAITKPIG
jgi:hypothetical protein